MKVYFAGSRKWPQDKWNGAYRFIADQIRDYLAEYGSHLTIITGDTVGADKLVGYHCYSYGVRCDVYGIAERPRILVYGSYTQLRGRTYAQRDIYLAEEAAAGVFVWNGSSAGTKAAMEYMDKVLHKPVTLWTPDGVWESEEV